MATDVWTRECSLRIAPRMREALARIHVPVGPNLGSREDRVTPGAMHRLIYAPGSSVRADYGDGPGDPARPFTRHWQPLFHTVADDPDDRDYLASHERVLADVGNM